MSDQTPKALRQSLLEQINADKKAVEALSDEELEEVAGGMVASTVSLGDREPNVGIEPHTFKPHPHYGNTGVLIKPQRVFDNNGVWSPVEP